MNTLQSALVEMIAKRITEEILASLPADLPKQSPEPVKLSNNARRHEAYRKRFGSLRPDVDLEDE